MAKCWSLGAGALDRVTWRRLLVLSATASSLPGYSPVHLAESCGLPASGVRRILRQLKAAGFVENRGHNWIATTGGILALHAGLKTKIFVPACESDVFYANPLAYVRRAKRVCEIMLNLGVIQPCAWGLMRTLPLRSLECLVVRAKRTSYPTAYILGVYRRIAHRRKSHVAGIASAL